MGNLKERVCNILVESERPFNATTVDIDGTRILDKIKWGWIQKFMYRYNIVSPRKTGRLSCSLAKKLHIEQFIAYHLGVLSRGFSSGYFNEDFTENLDETHFVINIDNGRTLGFTNIKYADVVCGGQAMTMVVRITDGQRAKIETPMMIFTNPNRSYPIQGLSDDILGVYYRSSPKGWMDKAIFTAYFNEPQVFKADEFGHPKHIWIDNCSAHNIFEVLLETLGRKRTSLIYLPPCTTHLCQPRDSFIISKIKNAWIAGWEAKKLEFICNGAWQDNPRADGSASGKLINPEKRYFLSLAVDSVAIVNNQRDENGMLYAQKGMIRCGLSLDVTGEWRIKQLFPHLQDIIQKHRVHFEGLEIPSI